MGNENGQTLKDKTASVVRVGGGRGFVVDLVDLQPRTKGGSLFERSETESVEIRSRIIVTAAHCLPMVEMTMDALEITKLDVLDGLNPGDCRQVLTLPPHRASYTHERTFEDLVGPLGGKASFSAECLYADPIADVALLGEPDNRERREEWDDKTGSTVCVSPGRGDEYTEFVDAVPPLKFSPAVFSAKRDKARVQQGGDPSSVWVLDLSNEWREVHGIHLTEHSIYGGFHFEGGMSGSPILDGGGQIVGLISTTVGHPHSDSDGSCPRLPHTLPRWFPVNE